MNSSSDEQVSSGGAHRMPEEQDLAETADRFGLLADPGRLRLLVALQNGELRVSELAEMASMSESATSHALRLLRAHRVVSVRRDGRLAYYSLDDRHVRMLLDVALAHAEHTSSSAPEVTHDRLSTETDA